RGGISRRVAGIFVEQVLSHQTVRRNGVAVVQVLNLILLEHAAPDPDLAEAAFEETAEVSCPDAQGRRAALWIDNELLIAARLFVARTTACCGPPIGVAASARPVLVDVRL